MVVKYIEYNGVSSVVFQILLGLQNKSFVIKDIEKIRAYAPVVKDLLPTFDYAIKNKKQISWSDLSFVNNYLSDKNSSVSDISSKLVSFVGVGESTPKTIKLGSRSVYDKLMNLWPDGEILGLSKTNGDGTVLTESSGFGAENKNEISSNHGEMVSKSVTEIADILELANRDIGFEYIDNFENSLVVFIGSPATAELICGDKTFYENGGFIVAKDGNYNDCDLILSPTDDGLVHIVLGNTKNNSWSYFEKEVEDEIQETVEINFSKASMTEDRKNEDFLRKQIKSDLNKLGLSNAIKFLDKNDFAKVAVMVFDYRKKNDEREISQRILENLFKLSLIVGSDRKYNSYKMLDNYGDLIGMSMNLKSKRKIISKESGVALIHLGDLEKTVKSLVKQKNYPSYSLVWILANGYGNEAIRN